MPLIDSSGNQGMIKAPDNSNLDKLNLPQVVESVTPTKPTVPKFSLPNSQSDGVRTLKKIEFEFKGKSYKFALNPEESTQEEPNRVTVNQTKSGAFIDDFGGGVQIITMKGTTGFKGSSGIHSSGFDKFKELRDLIRQFYFNKAPGTVVNEQDELVFHNYTDGEHWVVTPQTFKLMRSVARPLLYLYDITLICERPADQPSNQVIIDNNIITISVKQVEVNK